MHVFLVLDDQPCRAHALESATVYVRAHDPVHEGIEKIEEQAQHAVRPYVFQ